MLDVNIAILILGLGIMLGMLIWWGITTIKRTDESHSIVNNLYVRHAEQRKCMVEATRGVWEGKVLGFFQWTHVYDAEPIALVEDALGHVHEVDPTCITFHVADLFTLAGSVKDYQYG